MKKLNMLGMAVVTLALSISISGTAKADTVTEAKEFNGHYYQVVTQKANYQQAELQCELKGAHLATITSKEEQDFIYSLTGKEDVWIGGEYRNSNWTWVTGEAFAYTNWKSGQPSSPKKEKFLHFWNGKGEWDDTADKEQAYVMEWESQTDFTAKAQKFLNVYTYNGHSYKYFPGSVTWEEADKICKSLGGYLVTITSEEENNFVYKLLDHNRDTWIGLNDARKNGKYVWVTKERTDYRKFGKEVNSGFKGKEKYFGFYDTRSGYGKKWNDFRNESSDMAFVCEWDDTQNVILTKVKSTVTVKKGKKVSLQYQIYPVKKKVTFKSSNKKVATVTKKGVVKGIKKGTAKITIKAGNKKTVVKVKVK